jgi:hypothetical protein
MYRHLLILMFIIIYTGKINPDKQVLLQATVTLPTVGEGSGGGSYLWSVNDTSVVLSTAALSPFSSSALGISLYIYQFMYMNI